MACARAELQPQLLAGWGGSARLEARNREHRYVLYLQLGHLEAPVGPDQVVADLLAIALHRVRARRGDLSSGRLGRDILEPAFHEVGYGHGLPRNRKFALPDDGHLFVEPSVRLAGGSSPVVDRHPVRKEEAGLVPPVVLVEQIRSSAIWPRRTPPLLQFFSFGMARCRVDTVLATISGLSGARWGGMRQP